MGLVNTGVFGEVRAEVRGACPESVLNAAALEGIEIWELACVDNYCLRFSFFESDRKVVESLAEKNMCEIAVETVKGGSRIRLLARRRAWLAVFLVLTLLLLAVSSLFIWEIDVRGNEELSRGEIVRALSECGVDHGTFWPSVSSDILRSEMIEKLPEIGWMAFNVNGSRAVVLISERQEKPEIYSEKAAADIVSSKAAVIKKISVLNGRAVKMQGDAVTEGETLISGTMDSIASGSRYVCARGRVLADTWYELSAVCPRNEIIKKPAADAHRRYALVWGKTRINLYFSSGKAIDGCDKIIKEYKLGAEGLFAMPVKLICEKLQPYSVEKGSCISPEKMKEKLLQCVSTRVRGEIRQQSFTPGETDELFVMTFRAHCVEDIAESMPYGDYSAGG